MNYSLVYIIIAKLLNNKKIVQLFLDLTKEVKKRKSNKVLSSILKKLKVDKRSRVDNDNEDDNNYNNDNNNLNLLLLLLKELPTSLLNVLNIRPRRIITKTISTLSNPKILISTNST